MTGQLVVKRMMIILMMLVAVRGRQGQQERWWQELEWMKVGIETKVQIVKGKPQVHHHSEGEMSFQKPEKKENHSRFISSLG